jgi:hypothetical protein
MKAIQIHEYGGADILKLEEIEIQVSFAPVPARCSACVFASR